MTDNSLQIFPMRSAGVPFWEECHCTIKTVILEMISDVDYRMLFA